MIYNSLGKNDFENEVKVLELDFVRTYKDMTDNERKMANGDAAKEKEIEETFRKNFAEFFNDGGLKKSKDIQASDFQERLKKYSIENGIEFPSRLNTEAAKMQLVHDQHTEKIDLLYSYLSVLQHFSGRAYNFYKTKEYMDFNPHLTMMNLFFVTLSIIQVIKVLNADEVVLGRLVSLAKEMIEL
jgi:hypothetical protein